MFKLAYVRGIQNALINGDYAAFPDQDSASKVADYIAQRVDVDPLQGVPYAVAQKIAGEIIAASDWYKTQPGFKVASFHKAASWDDVAKLASAHALDLMEKAAEGSTIEGGDKGNSEPSSAEGKMDAAERPVGYAEHSVGSTAVDTKPGAVGAEQDTPNGPSNSPMGSNSITEQRTASLHAMFRKAAEGSTILGGDKGNDEPTTAEGKMDMADRPVGYAKLPSQGAQGVIAPLATGSAIIGREIAHPNGPSESPDGSNSLTEHSSKAASADPFVALFKKTAMEVARYIPGRLPETIKVAHVRACMGMTTDEKVRYLSKLAEDEEKGEDKGEDKDKGENPFASKSESKSDDGDKDKDDKKSGGGGLPPWLSKKIDSDKADDEKKEASLDARMQRVAAAMRR